MINKLLITCLHRNKRLVLPTLGAFIRKNIEGVGVVLVFVPFLNKDDGVLLSAIKSWAGIEDAEAQEILTEYIAAIKTALDERGRYHIEGIGVLKYDVNHIICLTKEEQKDTESESEIEPEEKEDTSSLIESNEEPISAAEVTPPVIEAEPIVENKVITPTELKEDVQPENTVPEPEEQTATPKEEQPERIERPNFSSGYQRQSFENKRQRPIDVGTRFFSPERDDSDNIEEDIDAGATPFYQRERRKVDNNVNETGSTQRADVNSVFSRHRDQNRINNIYGNTNTQPTINRPNVSDKPQQQRRTSSPQQRNRQNGHATPKKKNNDLVLWVAIIAILLTVAVLVYGYMHGGEQTLEALDVHNNTEIVTQESDSI